MSITARGGYQIVDFKGIDLPLPGSDNSVNIPGIFNDISSAVLGGKMVIISGIHIGGIDITPYPLVTYQSTENTFEFDFTMQAIQTITVHIDDDDTITTENK